MPPREPGGNAAATLVVLRVVDGARSIRVRLDAHTSLIGTADSAWCPARMVQAGVAWRLR